MGSQVSFTQVRFGFDYASCQQSSRRSADQQLPQQRPRDFPWICVEELGVQQRSSQFPVLSPQLL
jgi:hypothetical protein